MVVMVRNSRRISDILSEYVSPMCHVAQTSSSFPNDFISKTNADIDNWHGTLNYNIGIVDIVRKVTSRSITVKHQA